MTGQDRDHCKPWKNSRNSSSWISQEFMRIFKRSVLNRGPACGTARPGHRCRTARSARGSASRRASCTFSQRGSLWLTLQIIRILIHLKKSTNVMAHPLKWFSDWCILSIDNSCIRYTYYTAKKLGIRPSLPAMAPPSWVVVPRPSSSITTRDELVTCSWGWFNHVVTNMRFPGPWRQG